MGSPPQGGHDHPGQRLLSLTRKDVFTFEDVSSSRFECIVTRGCSRPVTWVPSALGSRRGPLVVHVEQETRVRLRRCG